MISSIAARPVAALLIAVAAMLAATGCERSQPGPKPISGTSATPSAPAAPAVPDSPATTGAPASGPAR